MIVYRCEDSIESIFTAVYQTYEEKRDHEDTLLTLSDAPLLFAEDISVQPDLGKVRKVMNTLRQRFGESDYFSLCLALSSYDAEKVQAIYRTIVSGLRMKCRQGHLFDNLSDEYVNKAFFLARNAEREYQHMRGFLRFEELENRVLYSKIGPKNNIVTFLMPHFADRFPMENFMIYDDVRNFFAIHPAGRPWYLLSGEEVNGPLVLKLSDAEMEYRELFRHFCQTITIKDRKSSDLQRNMLPLRFREYMVEF